MGRYLWLSLGKAQREKRNTTGESERKTNLLWRSKLFIGVYDVMRYNKISFWKSLPMKAYSVDLREKIVEAHLTQKMSIRKVATVFAGA